MATTFEELLRSPRLRVWHEQVGRVLDDEQVRRERFRDEMTQDTRAEFINGETHVHSPAKFRHNATAERIFMVLRAYVRRHDLGHVGHEKYLVGLTRNDVEPDVCYWRKEVSATFTADQMVFPPPDLVVEVLSPSTADLDRGVKFDDYAAHGVAEYWIVDPDARTLEQYLPDGDAYVLAHKSSDGTAESRAVPGLRFPVSAAFDDAACDRAMAGDQGAASGRSTRA